jgi:hypothetical protein
MTYNANLTALHKGLTPIHADQDRLNFAPKLVGDIRIITDTITPESGGDPYTKYLTFNHVYSSSDSSDLSLHIPELEGTVWVLSDIQGWWNIPDLEIPNIDRGFGDGSFEVTGRYLARDLTLTGSVVITATSRADIATKSQAVRKNILSAFNLTKRGAWLIVDEDNYKRAMYVRLSGKPEISTVNSKGRIDFSIGLRSADPIKYEWIDDSTHTNPIGQTTLDDGINGYNSAFVVNGSVNPAYRVYNTTLQDVRIGGDSSTGGYYGNADDGLYSRTEYLNDVSSVRIGGDTTTNGYYGDSGDGYYFRSYSGDVSSNVTSPYVTIDNHGDTDVPCYFRIIGPLYGEAIIQNQTEDGTVQTITILAPVPPATQILVSNSTLTQYLDIDTKTREVRIGDYNSLTPSSSSSRGLLEPLIDWIYLAPGRNEIYFNDSGTGSSTTYPTLEIYWRSGWVG